MVLPALKTSTSRLDKLKILGVAAGGLAVLATKMTQAWVDARGDDGSNFSSLGSRLQKAWPMPVSYTHLTLPTKA